MNDWRPMAFQWGHGLKIQCSLSIDFALPRRLECTPESPVVVKMRIGTTGLALVLLIEDKVGSSGCTRGWIWLTEQKFVEKLSWSRQLHKNFALINYYQGAPVSFETVCVMKL